MNWSKRLGILAALALSLCVASAGAQDKPKKKILFVTHSGGFIHSSVVPAEKILKELGDKNNFEVTTWRFTGDPDVKKKYKTKVDGKDVEMEGTALDEYSARFKVSTREPVTREQCGRINADTLKKFDAVFFFTTGDPVQSDDEMNALLDYVKSGKGFMGTHCATDTLYKRQPYGEMIGAYFDGHPLGGKTKVLVEDTKHPITQGLGESFEISDELYQFRDPYSRDKLRVLMRLDPAFVIQAREREIKANEDKKTKLKESIAKLENDATKKDELEKARKDLKNAENFKPQIRRTDNDYAMAWVREYGKGRVFYTALGHGDNVWKDPRFQNMVINAVKWSTGEVPGEAAPSGSKK